MKQYRSHKAVEAAKVLTVFENPDGSAVLELRGDQTEVREMVTRDWAWKHTERGRISLVGGYFVRYADGYTSWSPAKAFEEGYTEVGDAVPGLPVAGYKPTQSSAKSSAARAGEWNFGVHACGAAAALRELAGKIETGEIAVSRVKHATIAKEDEYTSSLLTIVFSEKIEARAEAPAL